MDQLKQKRYGSTKTSLMVHTVQKFNQATSFLNGLVVHVVLGHLCQTCHVTDTKKYDLLKLLFHPRPKLNSNQQ